jgi:allophanate hydrolase subunit 2
MHIIHCASERCRRAALCETAVLLFSLEATEAPLERIAGASVIPMLSGETTPIYKSHRVTKCVDYWFDDETNPES